MSERVRNFATILYPESCVDNWKDILDSFHVPVLVSPLHDSDLSDDGSIKKPHYHLLFMFDSLKSKSQCNDYVIQLKSVGIEKVASLKGYARYLCHLDNPDKFQYSVNDVIAFGGASFKKVSSCSPDRHQVIRDMMSFIIDNDIDSFSVLLEYCAACNEEWFACLCDSSTFVIKEYLKSRYWDKSLQK